MKNILSKIKLHPLSIFFIFSACITGYFNMIIVLMIIITAHEIGHLIIITKFKYKIAEINFFPFGGIIKTEKDINSPLKEEIILAISGITAQLILGFIMFFLYQAGFIRNQFYHLFYSYNVILMIFNLLPIIPLDGHIILKSFLEYFFPYKKSFYISVFISLTVLIIFIAYNIRFVINNYIILGFLAFKIWEAMKNFPYLQLRFFLERIMKKYNFQKIKIIKGTNINKMFKEKKHVFVKDNKVIDEYDILSKKFDGNTNF